MVDLRELFPEDLYHSYIVEADPDVTVTLLREFFEERGDIQKGSIDVLCQSYDSFTISDSGLIKEWHSNKRVSNGKRICILGAKSINREAEQALLKMLEEPAVGTHFFLIVPSVLFLAPTILSRAHVVRVTNEDDEIMEKLAKKFIASKTKERVDLVGEIIKNYKDDESSGNLRYNATKLINELEKYIFEKFQTKKDEESKFTLKELHKSREFLSTPGASVKMILEHIALVI